MSIEEMCKLAGIYENLIMVIVREMTSEMNIIHRKPSIGSVSSGFKLSYVEELRRLLAKLCGEYYSTVSVDRLVEYQSMLECDEELQGSTVDKSTEEIARLWAGKSVLSHVKSALKKMEDFRSSNGMKYLTAYELCKYLCAELVLEGKTRLSVSGLYLVLFRFREIRLEYRFLFHDVALEQGIDDVVRSDDLDTAFMQLAQIGCIGISRGELGIFMDCEMARNTLEMCEERTRSGIESLCRLIG